MPEFTQRANEDEPITWDYPLEGGLPWSYKNPNIEVAITGKLLRYLYEERFNDGWLYRAVLAKANCFARMAPDDKAMLVSSF
jgi:magnesium-transporting ATPase (P-type)